MPAVSPALGASVNCGEIYTVKPGDTLSRISTMAYGISAFEVLVAADEKTLGENPNLLFVGHKLMVPCREDRRGRNCTCNVG